MTTQILPTITAIVSDAPIICEAEICRRMPKIYAVVDNTVDIDDYINELEAQKKKYIDEKHQIINDCYKYFFILKQIIEEQNQIILQMGGKPPTFPALELIDTTGTTISTGTTTYMVH
jgi:hypothetical protein